MSDIAKTQDQIETAPLLTDELGDEMLDRAEGGSFHPCRNCIS